MSTADSAPATATATALHALLLKLAATPPLGDPDAPLLDLLAAATGIECVYVTHLDPARTRQSVVVARHVDLTGVVVPDGTETEWRESLCKRALDAGIPYTAHAETTWADNAFRADHGIRTFISQPVTDRHGHLRGTLCLASAHPQPCTDGALALVEGVAQVIGHRLDRDDAMVGVQHRFEDGCRRALDAAVGRLDGHDRVLRDLQRAFHLA